MSVKTLEIDGRMVTGLAGQTIFDAAWGNGIRIPRLCHVGGLSDVGACRLCLVEIEGQKKLQAACLTPVEGAHTWDLSGRVELLASPLTDYTESQEADITLVEGAVTNP